ncbi:MAG: glycosyltransferase [Chloroflexota bacterium]|nr:glycosyltransferase [Chloroflexota bacterium]
MESVVRLLAVEQCRTGSVARVAAIITDDIAEHPFLSALRDAEVEVLATRLPGRAYLRERAWVGELCRRLRPHVVHTHGYRPDVLDAGVARGLGIPTVTTVHGFTGGDWKNRLYERVQRAAFRRFDAVVAVSRPLARSLEADGVRADRLHLLPNAYSQPTLLLDRASARRALSTPANHFLIGWVGRVSREKGPDILVRALPELTDLPLAVSFVGDGRELPLVKQLTDTLDVGSRVRWHGTMRDAGRLFPAFDVLVLSSRTEGMPIVLFEAMAAGVPIIAARVGGVPDVLGPEEALLTPAEDPAALAAAIRQVYDNPAGAAARARAACVRLARQFSVAPWVAAYGRIYHQAQRTNSTGHS